MQKTTRQLLIALVIVLLIILFYLIYKDIITQTGINAQSSMQIIYDSTAMTIKYIFLMPELDMKYAGTTMLLTSFAPDNDTKSNYPENTLQFFISALQTVPITVAITPIDSSTNYVETNAIPKVLKSSATGSITASGIGVVRITPK